jgi:hypothetical protein
MENTGGFMNRLNNFLVATFMSAAMFSAGAAQAMQIQQFDKMASEDKGEYVGLLMVGGAEQAFKDEGRADLAEKVEQLFTTTLPGDKITIGVGEFQLNLARARVADSERAAKDPNAHRLEVEDAMLVTLKKNNIPLSQDFIKNFRAVAKDFKPEHPFQVMEIRAFDKMTDEDQTGYILQMLLVVAKPMTIPGEKPLAAEVTRLFTETPAGQKTPLGMSEVRKNLAAERLADARAAAQTPPGPRVWVEDAMADTLRHFGFEVPNSLFTGAKDFKPTHPPGEKPAPATPPPPAPSTPPANDDDPIGGGGFITPPNPK